MLTRGKIETEKLAYAAALLECEGSLTVSRGGKWKTVSLHISIANTDKRLVDFLQETFGGNIYAEAPRGLSKRLIYRWKIFSNQAVEFLRLVRPYMRIKTKQADLGIAMQDARHEKRFSFQEAEYFWQTMKALNRGESPAETKRENAETNLRCDSPTLAETPVS